MAGITSACAEQTTTNSTSSSTTWDHLRVCGADKRLGIPEGEPWGSPPRVRSRRRAARVGRLSRGITSACAEQTWGPDNVQVPTRDHLRVCGADHLDVQRRGTIEGSPPRVRSRRGHQYELSEALWITSACAEQTPELRNPGFWGWDHLRVCGADSGRLAMWDRTAGSPPRVRSRHVHGYARMGHARDHLRVCGADVSPSLRHATVDGSPPRVRSRPVVYVGVGQMAGITSACAEQTLMPVRLPSSS